MKTFNIEKSKAKVLKQVEKELEAIRQHEIKNPGALDNMQLFEYQTQLWAVLKKLNNQVY